jgi:hypothetical protein
VHLAIAAAVVGIEGIRAVHLYSQLRHPLRGVWPWPRGGQHPVKVDIANPVRQDLVRMAVDNHNPLKPFQDRLDLFGIVGPEVPFLI